MQASDYQQQERDQTNDREAAQHRARSTWLGSEKAQRKLLQCKSARRPFKTRGGKKRLATSHKCLVELLGARTGHETCGACFRRRPAQH
jgi:hypothetical protein